MLAASRLRNMKVTEVAFTGYPVTDIARARSFYEDILQLENSRTFESPNGSWIEYDLGESAFAISNMSKEWKPSGDGPAIAFEVDDFDAAVERLRTNGVKFVADPFDNANCRMTIISDPDGNTIIIHKRRPQ
jgi:predicted enzyme related to lactoylglutathione lyase